MSSEVMFYESLFLSMGNMMLKIDDYSITVDNNANLSLDEETINHVRRFVRTGIEMMKRTKNTIEEIEGTIVYPSIFKIRYSVNDNKVELRCN